MTLEKTITEILRLNGWSQTELAAKVGTNQPTLSQMKYGPEWEQHWQIFVKLVAICVDLDLIEDWFENDSSARVTQAEASGTDRDRKIDPTKSE